MRTLDIDGTTVEYEDTGGPGPTVVLVHGLLMDETLWTPVVERLQPDHRCIVPVLPLGAHRHPLPDGADRTIHGVAALLAAFLDRLGLEDVVLVGNDTGGAVVQLLMAQGAPRVSRVVLASCDAYDNYPPGATGKTLVATGMLSPGMFGLFMQQMRVKPLRRLPISFGWLTKRGDAVVAGWLRPVLTLAGVRRDTVALLRSISRERTLLVDLTDRLPAFPGEVRVVWARDDRVMPPQHGRRLADTLAGGDLVEIEDSYTLLSLDAPDAFAAAIREFAHRPRKDRAASR